MKVDAARTPHAARAAPPAPTAAPFGAVPEDAGNALGGSTRPISSAAPHRVAVFRALMLGDLLCATPALRALRAGLPQAHISLVGLPWAQPLAGRLASVDGFIACPGWPGLPEQPLADTRAQVQFLVDMRQRHFDLALQLHGSGGVVNRLVAGFGAHRTAGFADAAAWRPPADEAAFTDWPTTGTEVERMLRLTDHLGLPRQGLQLDFPLRPADREEAALLLRRAQGPGGPDAGGVRQRAGAGCPDGQPFAIVHPGSQLPSRRWPAERFAAVADALAAQGVAVVLTGSAGEAPLTRAVAAAMRHSSLDLSGQTTLWTLGALVEGAALVLSNDTGISHIAAALGTPSVVVASGGDVARWAPHDAERHRVFWHDTACRPCAHATCPYEGHPCASGVGVDEIRQAALQHLQQMAVA